MLKLNLQTWLGGVLRGEIKETMFSRILLDQVQFALERFLKVLESYSSLKPKDIKNFQNAIHRWTDVVDNVSDIPPEARNPLVAATTAGLTLLKGSPLKAHKTPSLLKFKSNSISFVKATTKLFGSFIWKTLEPDSPSAAAFWLLNFGEKNKVTFQEMARAIVKLLDNAVAYDSVVRYLSHCRIDSGEIRVKSFGKFVKSNIQPERGNEGTKMHVVIVNALGKGEVVMKPKSGEISSPTRSLNSRSTSSSSLSPFSSSSSSPSNFSKEDSKQSDSCSSKRNSISSTSTNSDRVGLEGLQKKEEQEEEEEEEEVEESDLWRYINTPEKEQLESLKSYPQASQQQIMEIDRVLQFEHEKIVQAYAEEEAKSRVEKKEAKAQKRVEVQKVNRQAPAQGILEPDLFLHVASSLLQNLNTISLPDSKTFDFYICNNWSAYIASAPESSPIAVLKELEKLVAQHTNTDIKEKKDQNQSLKLPADYYQLLLDLDNPTKSLPVTEIVTKLQTMKKGTFDPLAFTSEPPEEKLSTALEKDRRKFRRDWSYWTTVCLHMAQGLILLRNNGLHPADLEKDFESFCISLDGRRIYFPLTSLISSKAVVPSSLFGPFLAKIFTFKWLRSEKEFEVLDLPNKDEIPVYIVELMKSCWRTEPSLQPSIDDCIQQLEEMSEFQKATSEFEAAFFAGL